MRLISPAGLREKGIVFSKAQLYRLMKAGKFPKTVQVGFKRVAWVESEIDAWMQQLIVERDEKAA